MTAKEFEKEFKSLYLPLGMYALRIVDDAEAAQDCVQNAFLKVWEGLCDGTEVDCFQAYMYRAVRNQCLSYLRSLRETADIDDIAEPTEEDVDTSERDAALWHAIDRLPDRCRQVFLLSKRDGLSCRDGHLTQDGQESDDKGLRPTPGRTRGRAHGPCVPTYRPLIFLKNFSCGDGTFPADARHRGENKLKKTS